MFSSILPDYESNLKEELFNCFKYVGIPFDILERMPVRDRKFYIQRHNKADEEARAAREGTSRTTEIDGFTDMSQQKGAR